MSNFKKTKINSKVITIIDLWSYKIRVAICEYNKNNIKLLGFAEKRQSIWDIIWNNIENLENVCENLSIAISKAEKQANIKSEFAIINSTFSATFLESTKE